MLISFVGFFDAQINVDCDDEDEETSAGSDEGSAKGGSFSGSGKLQRPASEEQREEELCKLMIMLFIVLARNKLCMRADRVHVCLRACATTKTLCASV